MDQVTIAGIYNDITNFRINIFDIVLNDTHHPTDFLINRFTCYRFDRYAITNTILYMVF